MEWRPQILTEETETVPRGLYYTKDMEDYEENKEVKRVAGIGQPGSVVLATLRNETPNLIGSKLVHPDSWGGPQYHAPVIDIDLPCRLIPSSTKDHYHLLIDSPIREDLYFKMLDAMAEAGVVEYGFAKASKKHGQSFVRFGCLKKPRDDDA